MLDLWKESKMLLSLMVVMLILDGIYLSLIKNSFDSMITSIQKFKMEINLYYAIVVYFFMILGLYYFVIKEREDSNKTKLELSLRSGLLGLVIYAVFEFTNLAIFKNYQLGLALIDTFWGSILFSLTTYISLSIFN